MRHLDSTSPDTSRVAKDSAPQSLSVSPILCAGQGVFGEVMAVLFRVSFGLWFHLVQRAVMERKLRCGPLASITNYFLSSVVPVPNFR